MGRISPVKIKERCISIISGAEITTLGLGTGLLFSESDDCLILKTINIKTRIIPTEGITNFFLNNAI